MDVIAVVGIQITLDEGTFFAWMKGWKQLEIRDGKAAELGDQNGKRMFADLFITIVFFIQILKKGMKIKQCLYFCRYRLKRTVFR